MRFYPLLDFQYVVLAVFLAVVFLLLLVLAFRTYTDADKRRKEPGELEKYPEGLSAANNPVPLVLIFLMAALAVWAVSYVIVVGIRGPAF